MVRLLTLALLLLLAGTAYAHAPSPLEVQIGGQPCGVARYDRQAKAWHWTGCAPLEQLLAPVPADMSLCWADSPLTCWKVGSRLVLGKCRADCACIMRADGRWCVQ